MLFQLLTPLLAHPDPLFGIFHHLNPTWAIPGSSLGSRPAFSAVCSLPCHRDAAMQPLHPALSPKRNIAHHTEILHKVFKSFPFSLLTPLHNLMPTITWEMKFYLNCNYAILRPPFHQTSPFLIDFHSLVSVPREWFAPFQSKETETQGHSQTCRVTRAEVQLSHFSCATCPQSHACVLWETNSNKK